jgi:hypothetical protein
MSLTWCLRRRCSSRSFGAQPLGPDKEITRETMEPEPAASLGVQPHARRS